MRERSYFLALDSEQATLAAAGGKGANLARLVRAGLPVPPGFLLTTAAYHAFVAANDLTAVIEKTLAAYPGSDPLALQGASKQIREHFAQGRLPAELAAAIGHAYADQGAGPVAVRSSATAEDLPESSFAGQQDTFLHVIGEAALLKAVVDCWSSLWTARAIGYRTRSGIDHADVALAVVVQAMVDSEASGVLFTANPLNGRRTEMVVDATLGLGEALVSGQVEPDHYVVDPDGIILSRTLGAKNIAMYGRSEGGIQVMAETAGDRAAVPDEVILELAVLGRQVAALFGFPQDIEWAWAGGRLHLVQSRPITSLYPLPEEVRVDGPLRLFFSFGAVQGMLDPMTPLGQEIIAGLFVGAATLFGYQVTVESQRVLWRAGERLFSDMTPLVGNVPGRKVAQRALAFIEPGVVQTLSNLWSDPRLASPGRFVRLSTLIRLLRFFVPVIVRFGLAMWRPEWRQKIFKQRFAVVEADFTRRCEQATTLAEQVALLDALFGLCFPFLLPQFIPVIAGGMASLNLLNRVTRHLPADVPDILLVTRGLPHNVTTEMDLRLWETARMIRDDDESGALFAAKQAAELAADYQAGRLPKVAQGAVGDFLDRYGMRGLAEIDFGRPRWRDEPEPVMQVLQSYLQIEDGDQAPDVVFKRGQVIAAEAVEQLAAAARQTRGGRVKARIIRFAAHRIRTLSGLRESPKFLIIRIFGLARARLLAGAEGLVQSGLLNRIEDIFFLRLAELRQIAAGAAKEPASGRAWTALVAERRARYDREKQRRQIPRLFLSDGQAFYEGVGAAAAADDAVLMGSPVSPGVVEGVVHVLFDPYGAQLKPGEILVCPGTDPAWTPLFLAAGGLIMEVGGLMTHGSVVAREYGIPAVVGVHQATTRLQSGQRVRVDGSSGQVVVLE